MTKRNIILLGGLFVLLSGGGLVPVREEVNRVPVHTANAGELTGEVLVGQTFVAENNKLASVAIMFATYSGRENTKPVNFSLVAGGVEGEVVRSDRVLPNELGDNQFYRFDFEPIENSAGQTFFFFVRSPDSVAGDAVTIDLHTEDPYNRGSAYIARGLSAGQYNEKLISRSGKSTVDVVFGEAYSVPAGVALWHSTRDAARHFVVTWDEARSTYVIWGKVGLMSVLAILLSSVSLMLPARRDKMFLGLLLVLALLFRIMYAIELPLTNDEGNYLYDARTLLQGKLAGGDGYVKAPLVVAWVALWSLLDQSIIAGRMSAIVAGTITLLPLYFLAKSLAGRKAGLAAASLWAVLGVTTVFNIYVHTQSLAIFFGVSGLALVAAALKRPTDWRLFLAAGVVLGLGVVSRKSVLALGLVPLVLVMLESRSWSLRFRRLVLIGAGFSLIIALFLGYAGMLYGQEGVLEAAGFNSAEDGVNAVEPGQEEQVRAYSLRGMTPFFRESLALILLAVIGLGVALEKLLPGMLSRLILAQPALGSEAPAYADASAGRQAFRPWRPRRSLGEGGPKRLSNPLESIRWQELIATKATWLVPIAIYWWAWGFFAEYEGSSIMVFGMEKVWYAMAAVLILIAALPRATSFANTADMGVGRDRDSLRLALTGGLWVAGLVFFYMNWIKFHANYIGEFLSPLVLLAGAAVPGIWESLQRITQPAIKWAAGLGVVAILMWALFVSNYVTFLFEHTGTFQQGAVKEAAAWARENIPLTETIFTGAAIVPYLSGHQVALDIAHPRWYAYEFTRKDIERINTFLPSAEEMVQAFRDSEWFLLESQTAFSFLMEYSEIEAGLEKDFESVKGISNGSNTLTFYRRVR